MPWCWRYLGVMVALNCISWRYIDTGVISDVIGFKWRHVTLNVLKMESYWLAHSIASFRIRVARGTILASNCNNEL